MIEFVLCSCPLQTISTHIKTYTRHSWQMNSDDSFANSYTVTKSISEDQLMTFIPVPCTLTTYFNDLCLSRPAFERPVC